MSDYDSDGSVFSIGDSPAKPSSSAAAAKSKSKPAVKGKSSSAAKRDGPSVEEIYQKKTPVEHVLLRPDTYIGSVEPIEDELWVMDLEKNRMVQRKITFTPGLYKIVDEILVNAADNKARDPSMKRIDITIDKESGVISVKNDGKGIPIEIHKEQNIYVPELIFGHLLTSSNYNDKQEKTTGGRNGYGAKLCNIFSTEFIVETADISAQKKYVQVFNNNMNKIGKPKITKYSLKKEYTSITFKPDFAKFHMTHLDEDTIALITKRAYDLAGCVEGVNVYLNGSLIPIKNFKSYVELYLLPPSSPDEPVVVKKQDIVYKRFSDRWEVVFAVSEGQFNQVSFVNSINTLRGGTHVKYIADQIINEFITSTKKGKVQIKPYQVKNNMWLFVNCKIVNPAFDSQTKETLTLRASAFGSTCKISEDFMRGVLKSELKEFVDMMIKRKDERDLKKTDGTRTSRLTGIDKLDDANLAGTRHSKDCTLILTEGDSAKTLAVAGLGVQGRDKFGIFALRGKPLNVRDAAASQISNNKEFTNIKQILGLKHGAKYTSTDQLRYGHVLIMADQDVDGSHIKGLVINMFDSLYPGLLEVDGFLQQFITPVVRATQKRTGQRMDFYTESEFKRWFAQQPESGKGWTIKYYKGLGTSKEADAHEYFRNLDFHRKVFDTPRPDDKSLVDMAFNKGKANERKEWLAAYQPGVYVDNNKPSVSIGEFINKELVLFSMEDNNRSIPSMVDGLKPGQRKILWTSLEANLTQETKVVILQGKVTEKAVYHHGDQSLIATIVGMAQDFVGSNNINLLMPEGGFGTRLAGGKDAASARYISTFLHKVARTLFHKNDDPLLENLTDDGKTVEPRWYVPVIPMVLVNGAEGIGTGWSTTIPNFNPMDIIANIRRMMNHEPMQPMTPWYRGFRGTIERTAERIRTTGIIEKISDTELHISELPIRVWTESYKTQLNTWMTNEKGSPIIKDFRYNASTLTVDITLTLTAEQMNKAEEQGLEERFKLTSTIPMTNMVCFDREGRLRRFSSPEEIIEDFYPLRLRYYQLRKENMAEKLGRDLQVADNRARFVMEIIQKKLIVNNRKRKDLIKELRDRDYAPMPKKTKAVVAGDPDSGESGEPEEASDYDYLLSMPIWNLTLEKAEKLLKEKDAIQKKLEELLALTPIDIWTTDLVEVEKVWEEMVAEYEQRLIDDEENRKGQGKGKGKGGRGGGKGRVATAKKTAAGTTSAAAAKRKVDVVKKENGNVDSLSGPAKKTIKTESAKPRISLKKEPDVKPSISTISGTHAITSTAVTLGSDLDDSDEDVALSIFKKAASKKLVSGATKQQQSLSDMFAKKVTTKPPGSTSTATVAPATTTTTAQKPAVTKKAPVKRKTVVSSDEEDNISGGNGGSDSDSDVDMALPPPRAAPSRRAAATTKKPAYIDISDESGEEDYNDDSDDYEMD
ncbi:DNA topoisomerase 2 [Coemansia sp. RSA 485]|nr:DNA topoisomerase 2 [Coemansia sp. RSA 485]